MAPIVPIRQPDQQRTEPTRRIEASPDAFGAGIGRALVSAGQNISSLSGAFEEAENQQAATQVTDAYTQASKRLRDAQLDPEKGLLNRQGKNAEGITTATEQTSQTIFAEISDTLPSEKAKEGFKRMWLRKQEAAVEGAAEYEFKQRKAYQSETKTSALDNLQTDAVANYNNEKALRANIDAARGIIRQNPEGLSPEGLEKLERQGISAIHASVVQRIAQDNPGQALDYYEKHKAEVEGSDHAAISGMIKGVSNVRAAKTATQEILEGGPAISIYNAVEHAESTGDPTAISDKGALGLMQLMPDTARETAVALGMNDVARMDDGQLAEFFATPEGQKANRTIGSTYLNRQLKDFDGDLEAALVAYNAGPANARKFLNGDRDYKALPKGSETYAYVKKVMAKYLGADLEALQEDGGSKAIQDAINPKQPGTRYQGDAQEFLLTKLAKGKDTEHISEMKPIMRDSLAALMQAAPDNIKEGLGILSGTRTVARQKQLWEAALVKYGSAEKARKWVAPPGNSQHNHGNAADLSWNGGYFSTAPADVQKWVHDNAARFGLTFPLPNEAWHIETEGARKGNRIDRSANATYRINQASVDNPPDTAGTVTGADERPSPASIYTATFKPYTVAQSKADLTDLLAQAESKYADNPALMDEVKRQITAKYTAQVAEQKAAVDQLQMKLFSDVLQGKSVQDMSRDELLQVGEDNVGKLMKMEEKFGKASNPDDTDEGAYYDLSRKSPEELRAINLMEYADKLSKADFKTWADRQGAVSRDATKSTASAQMRTRTQIVNDALDTLGLDPKPGTDDAKAAAMLSRTLDERVAAFRQDNGDKDPDATQVQKIVDELVMQGTVRKDWAIDTEKRVFELEPGERGDFYPGDDEQYITSFGDIPEERKQAVANAYTKINPELAAQGQNEEGYVNLYNDMVRIEQGASPNPPEDMAPKIRQAFARKYGRAPTLEEQATIYRKLVLKAAGQ